MEWLNDQKLLQNFLVIVLSGHGELENVRRAYGLGARSFVSKPCKADDIRNLVRGYSTYFDLGNTGAVGSQAISPGASVSLRHAQSRPYFRNL